MKTSWVLVTALIAVYAASIVAIKVHWWIPSLLLGVAGFCCGVVGTRIDEARQRSKPRSLP